MLAYDMEILKRPALRGGADEHGWCFGLPPGIAPHQWPLDPNNAYPSMHGFTLLLPEDYRVHGPEIVAVSFFAMAADHNDGGPTVTDGLRDVIASPGPSRPDDPALSPFWEAARRPHPWLHRMPDILDCDYAAVLLTQAEFGGTWCSSPPFIDSPLLAEAPAPRWLEHGAAAVYWDCYGRLPDADAPASWLLATLGGQPESDPLYSRALRLRPRRHDPNAGRIPRSRWREGDKLGDYEYPKHSDAADRAAGVFYKQGWANELGVNHVGGTMRSSLDVPAFSPFYVEFDEIVGGYSFGGGNAQLDFRDMKFDRTCG